MKTTHTIAYEYTVTGYATVVADSVEKAIAIVEADAPCPMPADIVASDDPEITKVNFLRIYSHSIINADWYAR
jgi:hypothetical protein